MVQLGFSRIIVRVNMKCVWCDKELTHKEIKHGNLCSGCELVSTGIPGLSREELDKLPFGLIELNRDGTIISFNRSEENLSRQAKIDVIGKNFFRDVAPCADVKEFHGRFDEFLSSGNLAEPFNYIYYFGATAVAVQLAFVRVTQEIGLVLSKRDER
jgi:photoactive yellow protein